MNDISLKGIPTFRILNYHKAKRFYIQDLGFKIDWEHRFGAKEPVYMQISKNELTLHLSENPRFKTGTIVFVACKGLIALHEELIENSRKTQIPAPKKTPWQTLQMEITDSFGNILRFNENIN
ncbi:MAG: VOC family protein [Bacteroidetes bacterium]|jgi:hypothetical protein|nr:VOC family protein [Bacteroidota bacterium]